VGFLFVVSSRRLNAAGVVVELGAGGSSSSAPEGGLRRPHGATVSG